MHRLVDNNISAQIGIVGPWPRVQLLQFLTKLPNFSSYRRQLHQSLNLFDNYILKKIIPFCKIFVYSYYTYFTWSVSRSLGRSFKLAQLRGLRACLVCFLSSSIDKMDNQQEEFFISSVLRERQHWAHNASSNLSLSGQLSFLGFPSSFSQQTNYFLFASNHCFPEEMEDKTPGTKLRYEAHFHFLKL